MRLVGIVWFQMFIKFLRLDGFGKLKFDTLLLSANTSEIHEHIQGILIKRVVSRNNIFDQHNMHRLP